MEDLPLWSREVQNYKDWEGRGASYISDLEKIQKKNAYTKR